MFDSQGTSFILEKDYLIATEQGVRLKSYDIENFERNNARMQFDLSKGCHFDHENQNFMMINEYISLSFSFMTLVIRDKHKDLTTNEKNAYQLDEELFKFNMNRKTFLTCDNFVTFDYLKL